MQISRVVLVMDVKIRQLGRKNLAVSAAVLPIMFVAMAFSILSTVRKQAGTRGGLRT
jgi:hypothetical protein